MERKNSFTLFGTFTFPTKLKRQLNLMPPTGFLIASLRARTTTATGISRIAPRMHQHLIRASTARPYGLMTTNTVNGNVPANLGTMPSVVHLDMNLRRAFTLNPQDKGHPRTLAFNARSANLLNHTNVTTVNSVLSSSATGQPVAAEPARRVELGVRFEF